jgi:molecular chaperone DnaK (HSP70)
MLRRPDRSVTPLLFGATPLLSSAVFAGPDAVLLTGADAEQAATADPTGFEPNPKRRVDEGTVWLGEREVSVVDLVAAVLARVLHEARRVSGQPVTDVVLTHPATWGQARLGVLTDAAARAGLGEVNPSPATPTPCSPWRSAPTAARWPAPAPTAPSACGRPRENTPEVVT